MTQDPTIQVSPGVTETSVTGALCPRCHQRSSNEFYCEHCQFELPPATTDMLTINDLDISPIWGLSSFDVKWAADPTSWFHANLEKQCFRVRGIRPELWSQLSKDVDARKNVSLTVLPPVFSLELGGGALVFAQTWGQDASVPGYLHRTGLDDLLTDTRTLCRRLEFALSELHASGYVWLNFDPTALEVKDERLRITNLDWRMFPAGRCPSLLAPVSPIYSPPEVSQLRDEFISPRTDVFHFAMAAYYRLSGLGIHGFAGHGLESFHYEIPPLRVFRPDLPVGIWPVLRRALSINPSYRPESVKELHQQLEQVFEREIGHHIPVPPAILPAGTSDSLFQKALRYVKRETRPDPKSEPPRAITLDVGCLTTAGKAKTAVGANNQDTAIVSRETVNGREVLLMIVADGVTHALVGSGDRASTIGCKVLVDAIRELIQSCPSGSEPSWPAILELACQLASKAIVGDALAIPNHPPDIRDCDMMCTTALIGVLDGRDLYLANVGDSRAYLLKAGVAEQLTVDGDVASFQLQVGVPPEQIKALGPASKALRYCLGACYENEQGALVADVERSMPAVGQWQVERGDIFVMCSDGLVEERIFLEPDDLIRIVESLPGQTSQVLAERLVAAADARQRVPSTSEPNGYGDNITCIVLRVT